MPTLKNPRHERIAQLLASGKTATEAHQLAGFKRDRVMHHVWQQIQKYKIGFSKLQQSALNALW